MSSTHFSFEAIGTLWELALYDELSQGKAQQIEEKIKQRIEAFDKNYSRFREDSLVSEMARKAGVYELPSDAKKLLDLYQSLYKLTDGAFTPLIGQTLVDAGYDAKYSFQEAEYVSKPLAWEDVISYNEKNITIKQPALLDFGAAGKGYLIDIVSELLQQCEVNAYTINAGGDVLHEAVGGKTLRVGLEHPDSMEQVIGVVSITNQSICGSSGNRRKWGNYHHIINPKTGASVDTIRASWVISDTALIADALATALFFTSPEKLQKEYDFAYLLLDEHMQVEKSPNFGGELFLKA